jgi:threonine aldolase
MRTIDLRSDTVTQPTDAMREAMLRAPVGDDVYGEDPTVNALQDRLAADLGFAAALFVPTGTQSNLLALMSHCERGDEYIVGADAHTYRFEGGGAAVLGSIQPQPIPQAADGTLPLDKVEAAIKPVDPHFARSKLLALENTWHGRALPFDYLAAAREVATRRGLGFHLDGARLYNAAIAYGRPAREVAAGFDSVSVCLSKGLGAPVGSVLLGPKAFIEQGKRWRKMLGGGMRQAGVIAAAAQYALEHNVERLADDHQNAADLSAGLAQIEQLRVTAPQTNIFYVEIPEAACAPLREHLAQRGIRASIGPHTRLVTHLDVSRDDVQKTITAFKAFFK